MRDGADFGSSALVTFQFDDPAVSPHKPPFAAAQTPSADAQGGEGLNPMRLPKKAIVLSVLATILVCVTGGRAQQDSIGDLGLTVRQDDLDSYWLNTQNWLSYGYRPY